MGRRKLSEKKGREKKKAVPDTLSARNGGASIFQKRVPYLEDVKIGTIGERKASGANIEKKGRGQDSRYRCRADMEASKKTLLARPALKIRKGNDVSLFATSTAASKRGEGKGTERTV